jgi:protein TonB
MAPQVVPDAVPVVDPPVPSQGDPVADALSGGPEPGPVGELWGRGEHGPPDGPPAGEVLPPAPEPIFEPGGEVKPPELISRVEPRYPEFLRITGMPATVVVRCVIDKNGRVRDPEIVVPAMEPFNKSVLSTLPSWRYKPGSRHGKAVETYLTLTVRFSVQRGQGSR